MTQVAPAFDAPPSQGEDEGPGGDAALPASLFPVPRVPKIGRHKEPRPFHKSAPGYDMKTLRRQLEGMYEDLEERYLLQRALYSQNEQLWAYAASLLELNRSYSTQTAEHLGKLHNRFQLLQDERESICMRLIEAQVSRPLCLGLPSVLSALSVLPDGVLQPHGSEGGRGRPQGSAGHAPPAPRRPAGGARQVGPLPRRTTCV